MDRFALAWRANVCAIPDVRIRRVVAQSRHVLTRADKADGRVPKRVGAILTDKPLQTKRGETVSTLHCLQVSRVGGASPLSAGRRAHLAGERDCADSFTALALDLVVSTTGQEQSWLRTPHGDAADDRLPAGVATQVAGAAVLQIAGRLAQAQMPVGWSGYVRAAARAVTRAQSVGGDVGCADRRGSPHLHSDQASRGQAACEPRRLRWPHGA